MNLLDFDVRNFNQPGRSLSLSTKGMVVSSHHLASSAGASFLREGGNAADVAIVMSIVLCMAEPHMTGIGGDCFVLLSPDGKTNNIRVLNASGYAGINYNTNIIKSKGIQEITPSMAHSVTVPGSIAGWELLHKSYGNKPWKEIFSFALDYIKDGVLVAERVATDWIRNKEKLRSDTDTKEIFLKQGKPFKFGEVFKNIKLIETLDLIANEGSRGFYNGYVAEDICKKLLSLDGLQTLEDFSNFEAEWLSPIKFDYKGFDIYECPPNGQGITVFIILTILKSFNLSKLSDAEYYHLYIEAVKIAYLIRDKFVADPNFDNFDYEFLLNKKKLDSYIDSLSFKKASFFDVSDFPEHNDTIYLSVRDENGMTVSFINSLFDAFGSGITTANTGILLHSRGRSFNLKNNHPNRIQGYKRPLHTIIPGMIGYEKKVIGSFGVMGGHFQAAGHAFILSQIIDFSVNPQNALNLPRVFPNNGLVDIEEGFDNTIIKKLENLGHNINYPVFPIGGGQIILLDPKQNIILGASDFRKDGIALGL